MTFLEGLPLWQNLLIFGGAACVVWFSGVRLERAVEVISKCTGLGRAFGGLILLALSTSLPEIATSVTGAMLGNAALVTNNLLGGVVMQTAVLAVADYMVCRGALTAFAPRFSLLLGGVSLCLVLGLAMSVMAVGKTFSLWAVGLGSTLIFATHLTLLYLNYRSRDEPRWQPVVKQPKKSDMEKSHEKDEEEEDEGTAMSLKKAWIVFGIFSGLVLAAGWMVTIVSESITKQTGLGSSFVGATFVAIATSLPELSTTTSAARHGAYETAISNIFGSNVWDVSLLFVGDLFYRSGPLLENAPRQAMFTASLGVVVTCIYLWGLLERRNHTIGRIGIDSALVLTVYAGGLFLLYRMG